MVGRMKVKIGPEDVKRNKVDSRGRFYIGRAFVGKEVEIAILDVEEEDEPEELPADERGPHCPECGEKLHGPRADEGYGNCKDEECSENWVDEGLSAEAYIRQHNERKRAAEEAEA